MCGMDTVSFEDLKAHSLVSGSNLGFQQVLSWFWVVVSDFTQEEMARLLQFVTGCSQLPPGGFRELNPRFTVTSAPTTGRLPTAHTWCVCVCVCMCACIEHVHTKKICVCAYVCACMRGACALCMHVCMHYAYNVCVCGLE